MKNNIIAVFSDGTKISVPYSGQPVTAGPLTIQITQQDQVYCPHVVADSEIAVRAIEIEWIPDPGFFDDQLYFLDNMNQTNDIVHLRCHAQFPYVESKDVTVMKNKKTGQTFHIGFVTAWRFYAWIAIDHGSIKLHYEMEDKPLTPSETYDLERFILGEQPDANDFLCTYAQTVAQLNGKRDEQPVPTGFCSWSCLYTMVDEKTITHVADSLKDSCKDRAFNLIQIDDGWHQHRSFSGEWYADKEKFPNGMQPVADHVHDLGMRFGLWAAPLIVAPTSPHCQELEPILAETCTLGNIRPLDLSNPEALQLLRRSFDRMKNEYGADYFKIDFIAAAIHNFNDNSYVRFRDDYAVACLRRAFEAIRQTVGPDTYLLACGAPILECAGYFDGIRSSADIIWGKSPSYPTYWQIIKDVTRSILYRHFYHGRLFDTDADGLVVRDYDNGDGYDSTYSEARLWATTVAMSGGAVLLNDEPEKIGPARLDLFRQLLPALGIAARPLDYFELPQPTCSIIDLDEDTKFVALYRWEDEGVGVIERPMTDFGMDRALIIDCWTHTPKGISDTLKTDILSPHAAQMFCLRRVPQQPAFVYSDLNVWLGANRYDSTYENGQLRVQKKDCDRYDETLYAFYPDGFEIPAGTSPVYEWPEGRMVPAEPTL